MVTPGATWEPDREGFEVPGLVFMTCRGCWSFFWGGNAIFRDGLEELHHRVQGELGKVWRGGRYQRLLLQRAGQESHS